MSVQVLPNDFIKIRLDFGLRLNEVFVLNQTFLYIFMNLLIEQNYFQIRFGQGMFIFCLLKDQLLVNFKARRIFIHGNLSSENNYKKL